MFREPAKTVESGQFMTTIRPIRANDAPFLAGLLAQLGYPSELDVVVSRLASLLNSPTQQVLVAVPADDSRIDGYVGVERRLTLVEGERVEITGLVVDSSARRSGVGRALMRAAEQWAVQRGVAIVVVRSNVMRPESHPFYEALGYQRMKTSHTYHKEL